MMDRSFRLHFRLACPTLAAAFVLAFLPLATAVAQELPRVRVTRGDTTIRAMRYNTSPVWRLMQADAGTVFDVIDVDGDAQQFLPSNYYLVLLPRDSWGTQWVGWISGQHLEPGPPRERPQTTPPVQTYAAAPPSPRPLDSPTERAVVPAAMPMPPPFEPTTRMMPEVVLRFAFDRSDLSEAAKNDLTTALATMSAEAGSLSFALGGHADATGSDDYNQKLGLARADAVRAYIADQLRVPADRISVASYGESQPVAANDSPAGRAANRRVVVTVTAPASVAR